MSPVPVDIRASLEVALEALKAARLEGDQLKIDLAESALNDIIDRNRSYLSQLSRVTSNERE